MRLNRIELSKLMIRLVVFCSVSMVALSFFLDVQILAYFLFANIALSFALFLISFRGTKIYLMACFLAICVFIRYLFFLGTIKLVDSLIFAAIIFYAVSVMHIGIDKISKKIIFWGALVTVFLMFVNITQSGVRTYQGWLVYNFVNSNTAANVSLNLLAVLIISRFNINKTWKKVFIIVCEIGMIQVIWMTSSRSSFGAALAMELCAILVYFGKIKGNKIHLWTFAPIIAIPVMFLLFERFMGTDIELLGKPLFSGRETLWSESLSIIWNNLVQMKNDFTGGLNIALRMPYICGLLGTVLYFALLFYGTKSMQRQARCQNYKIGLLAIVLFECLLFQQSTESTLISGTYSTAFITMTVLGFAKSTGENMKLPHDTNV